MNKNVVMDIDGVLADFNGAFVKKFGTDRQELENLESRYPNRATEIYKFVSNPATYKDLEPIPLGLSIVDFLVDNGFDVDVVTSRPLSSEWVTRRWLKKTGIRYLSFGVFPNKASQIHYLHPICAVDDLISVSRLLTRYLVPVLVFQQPWNWFYEDKSQVFSNLGQFISAFQRIRTKKD